jgi:hypothetical protein
MHMLALIQVVVCIIVICFQNLVIFCFNLLVLVP